VSSCFYSYPKQALFERVLPKNKIYDHASPTKRVKDLFVSQVTQITWLYKLSPETINLPAKNFVNEIQIFRIICKSNDISEDVLRCVDEAIHYPVFFEIVSGVQIQVKAGYKTPNANQDCWYVTAYFESPWMKLESLKRCDLPVTLDLESLYAQMLRQLIPFKARQNEALHDQVARHVSITNKKSDADKIQIRLLKEKQFNRKVELNAKARVLNKEIKDLMS